MKNIKVVAFDMDNTLIDRQKAAFNCIQAMIKQDAPGKFNEFQLNELAEWFLIEDGEGHRNKELVFTAYIKKIGIDHRPWQDIAKQWAEDLSKHMVLMDHAIEVLDALYEKYTLALLTNGSVEVQTRKYSVFPHMNWFKTAMISDAYGSRKPDSALFLKLCELVEAKPTEVVYVGDHYANDILGAYHAGLVPIWFDRYNRVNENPKILTITSLLELLDVL